MTGKERGARGRDLVAQAAAVTGGPPAPAVPPSVVDEADTPPAVPVPVPVAAATPRVKPVRVTVELQPVEHRALRRLCERYAEELAAPQVAGAEVFRVLLNLAREDEDLTARVGAELRRTGGSRRRW